MIYISFTTWYASGLAAIAFFALSFSVGKQLIAYFSSNFGIIYLRHLHYPLLSRHFNLQRSQFLCFLLFLTSNVVLASVVFNNNRLQWLSKNDSGRRAGWMCLINMIPVVLLGRSNRISYFLVLENWRTILHQWFGISIILHAVGHTIILHKPGDFSFTSTGGYVV